MDQNTIYIVVAVVILLVIVLLIVNRRKRATTPAVRAHHAAAEGTPEARLSHLADLRSKGLVTEEEFEAQRRQIMGKL